MGGTFFSGEEVLGVALKIEENGVAFYEALSSKARRPELKALYDWLLGQEKAHHRVFSKMAQFVGKSFLIENYPGEQSAYMKALADSVVFELGEVEALSARINNDSEALETALGFEKDSIVFYSEILELVRQEDKTAVQKVIAEEKSHMVRLNEMERLLRDPGLAEYGH